MKQDSNYFSHSPKQEWRFDDNEGDIDQYQRLRDMEEYLYENYRSPTKQEIKKAIRLREIQQIDLKIT